MERDRGEEENDVVSQANDHIIKWAVESFVSSEEKAKGCRCENCYKEYKDSEDRLNWISGIGRWLKKGK